MQNKCILHQNGCLLIVWIVHNGFINTNKGKNKMNNRYTYTSAKTLHKAQEKLETLFATGEISESEKPLIEKRKNFYIITLSE